MIDYLICSRCGGNVSTSANQCDQCSADLRGIRCAACDFVGNEADFTKDRCPVCGCSRLLAIAHVV